MIRQPGVPPERPKNDGRAAAGVFPLAALPPFDRETKAVNVIVETPRGSRNKFKFDPELELFKLGSVLPAGMAFPYDFGYVPGTLSDDGDPLDVLLLMDVPATSGCLVLSRLIGVIEAEQKDERETVRNDRLASLRGPGSP